MWQPPLLPHFFLAMLAVVAGACAPQEPVGSTVGCVAPTPPRSDAVVTLAPAFPNVSVEDAVALVQGPDARWYVLAKPGVVYTFADDPQASPTVFLDITARVEEAAEAGLLGFAFHQDFPNDRRVFIHYNAPTEGDGPFSSRISSFDASPDGLAADASSEAVILDVPQPYSNHNGGDIGFGPDGMLYFALGDGGSAGDPLGSGQDTDTLLGAMLRIDIDGVAPYEVPPGNPFVDGGGRPEIFAWGFRNPYRWSFDPASGDLWVGDVGQHAWEEVNRVAVGQNYGWAVREGTDCLGADTCVQEGLVPPVAQYRNTGDASVVTGHVYAGDRINGLDGLLIYSDFYFGTVYATTSAGGEPRVLGEGARGIGGWARSADGELYGVNYFDGSIYSLMPAETAPAGSDPFPTLLSETGCVAISAPRSAADDTWRYGVNLPFWSDGAEKERFIALPEGARAEIGEDGDISLPEGTVLVKTFLDDSGPIETRLLVHHEGGGWAGYGYAWNEEGSEATYVERTRSEAIGDRTWIFPGTRECETCHTRAAKDSLGLELGQLTDADLEAWVERGWLDDPSPSPAFVEDDPRAYLHVNCSPCHRDKGTGGRANLDLRGDIPLAETGLCGSPRAGDLGIPDARIVAPGNASASVLTARMRAEASARMPPLGSTIVDAEGVAMIERWIDDLQSCP